MNKSHSIVGHYRIKMCAAFMTSCLQAGATLVKEILAIVYSCLLQASHLLSCVVLVDIFWKIEVVSVVDLDKGS